MAVLYRDARNPIQEDSKINHWYLRLHKYHLLVPLFPKDVDNADKWWYKLGYAATWVSSVWFFILGIYFIYLAYVNKFDWFYNILALGWMILGLFLPIGVYRLVIYYLKRNKWIY